MLDFSPCHTVRRDFRGSTLFLGGSRTIVRPLWRRRTTGQAEEGKTGGECMVITNSVQDASVMDRIVVSWPHAMDDGEGWRSLAICVAWCCIDVFGVVVMCFKLLGVVSVCFRLLGVVL